MKVKCRHGVAFWEDCEACVSGDEPSPGPFTGPEKRKPEPFVICPNCGNRLQGLAHRGAVVECEACTFVGHVVGGRPGHDTSDAGTDGDNTARITTGGPQGTVAGSDTPSVPDVPDDERAGADPVSPPSTGKVAAPDAGPLESGSFGRVGSSPTTGEVPASAHDVGDDIDRALQLKFTIKRLLEPFFGTGGTSGRFKALWLTPEQIANKLVSEIDPEAWSSLSAPPAPEDIPFGPVDAREDGPVCACKRSHCPHPHGHCRHEHDSGRCCWCREEVEPAHTESVDDG